MIDPGVAAKMELTKFSLSSTMTMALDAANSKFHTNIQDLIITAMLTGLTKLSGQNNSLRIMMEGHGREPWKDSLDVSRTIGWFTALYPVVFDLMDVSIEERLKYVKETLRSIPSKGITYSHNDEFQNEIPITFNYLGKFQGMEGKDAYFKIVNAINPLVLSPDYYYPGLLVSCFHMDEMLHLDVFLAAGVDQMLVSEWMNQSVCCLEDLVVFLNSQDCMGGFTHSDFDLIPKQVNMALIKSSIVNDLKTAVGNVEDIYPTSPLQGGLLSSLVQDPSSYVIQHTFELKGTVDSKRLQVAWGKVCENYESLRTAFISTTDGLFQVVLKNEATVWNLPSPWSLESKENNLKEFLAKDRQEGFNLRNRNFCRIALVSIEGYSI
jgi:hypothetical protein